MGGWKGGVNIVLLDSLSMQTGGGKDEGKGERERERGIEKGGDFRGGQGEK